MKRLLTALALTVLILEGSIAYQDNPSYTRRNAQIHSLGIPRSIPRNVQVRIQTAMKATYPTCFATGSTTSGWAEKMSDGSYQVYTSCYLWHHAVGEK